MNGSVIDRLKKAMLRGAQTSATRIEEAARTGKLHLDLMAERRRLARHFHDLGKEAHMALLEGTITSFPARPGISDLQAEIEQARARIADLDSRIAQCSRDARKPV